MSAVRAKNKKHDFIRRSTGEKVFDVVNVLIMAALLIFFLYPVLNVVSISLSNEYEVLASNVTFYP